MTALNVAMLIEELKKLPPEAEVFIHCQPHGLAHGVDVELMTYIATGKKWVYVS